MRHSILVLTSLMGILAACSSGGEIRKGHSAACSGGTSIHSVSLEDGNYRVYAVVKGEFYGLENGLELASEPIESMYVTIQGGADNVIIEYGPGSDYDIQLGFDKNALLFFDSDLSISGGNYNIRCDNSYSGSVPVYLDVMPKPNP